MSASPAEPRKFTRDVIWVAASLVTFAVGGAVWAVLTAHGLGTGGRGNLNLIGTAITLAALACGLGANYSLPSLVREDRFSTGSLVVSLLTLGAVVNGVVVAVYASVGYTLTIQAIYMILVVASVTLLPVSWAKTIASALLSTVRDFKTLFFASALGQVIQVGGGALLLVTDRMTVATAVGATTAGAAASLVVLGPHLVQAVRGTSLRPSTTSLRRIGRAASGAMPGVLGQSLNYRLDFFVVAALSGAEAVGIYGIAVIVAELLFYPALIVSQVLLPRAAQLGSGGAEPAYRIVVASTLAIAAVLFVAAPSLIRHVFGPGFLEASPALRALLPGLICLALWQLATFELAGRGKLFLLSASALTGVAVTLVADLVLVPRYNVRGAAIAATLGYLATAAVVLPALRRELGYRIRDLILLRRSDVALVRDELVAVVRALRPDRAAQGGSGA